MESGRAAQTTAAPPPPPDARSGARQDLAAVRRAACSSVAGDLIRIVLIFPRRMPLFLTSRSQHRLQVEQLLQERAAVQQQISLQNGNLLNLMDCAEKNELMQKREEIADLHVQIEHIDDVLQSTLQWKHFELGRYRVLISQLSRMQGTNAQAGHGLTNELESTGYGNQAVNMEGSQGTAAAENTNPTFTCSACYFRGACMLILPCQHLCACKSCEVNLTLCPVCGSAKTNAIEARFG